MFEQVVDIVTAISEFTSRQKVKGCVGAIDGTYVPCVVPAEVAAAYRNRKGFTSQNVMAVVDFEMKFTYIVVGWEGSAHDARVLNVAKNTPAFRFPHAPPIFNPNDDVVDDDNGEDDVGEALTQQQHEENNYMG
ncbi:hypothetical protein UlMin_024547 [Ulmus minor]